MSPSLEDVTDRFFTDRKALEEPFDDREQARVLRQRCEELIRVDPPSVDVSAAG